jgi:phospholipid/cholesterol/gamma-HCH transport system substrate-binding protein
MKNKLFSREVRVGLMVVVALFFLYLGLNFLKGIDIFSPVNPYYARYENLGGLVKSCPVYIKGYKVGQIDAIVYDFTKSQPFVVKFSVLKDIKLPKDVKVELFDDGLMGGKAVRLVFAPIVATSTFYMPQDTLPSTQEEGLMAKLQSTMLPKIESIAVQADSLVRSVRVLVENQGIKSSLNSLDKTTTELYDAAGKLKLIVANDVPKVVNDVHAITSDFKQVSANLKKVDLNSTFVSLKSTSDNLNKFTEKLNSPQGTLGLLLTDKDLYNNLTKTAASADNLLNDMKLNPKRYVHFSVFSQKN